MPTGRAVLFSDLDGTLIHSHRRELKGRKICVEQLDGKPQSYIAAQLRDYLPRQDWLETVPVTMRTCAQYARLAPLIDGLRLNFALVCNGAILLEGLEKDPAWISESYARCGDDLAALKTLLASARKLVPPDAVTTEAPFLFYVKAARPDAVYRALSAACPQMALYRDSRKVYCLSPAFRKGEALKRWREQRGAGRIVIAMGDSEPDISMLCAADYAVCGPRIDSRVTPGRRKFACDFTDPDALLECLEDIKKEVMGAWTSKPL